jgi:branched-chain amino acid transport system permease protein
LNGFSQQVVIGLAAGGIYALLALAIVLVRRATGVINFAQAALATLAALVAGALVSHGWRFWPAFGVTIALAFTAGLALERLLVRPARRGPPPGATLLTVGVLLAVNGLDTWIWGSAPRSFVEPFSTRAVHFAGISVPTSQLETAALALIVAGVVLLVLGRTKLGLGLRASAINPDRSRALGLNVDWLATFGWGIATAVGAVAGVLAAAVQGVGASVDPSLLRPALLYALAAAVIGGIDSPGGAVLAGFAVGVGVQLLGTYVHWVGTELRLASAFAALLVVLLVRPSGVFGRRPVGST